MVKHTNCPPDVTEVLERWRPANWNEGDLQILGPILPTIRGWVKQMNLHDAHQTRRFLLAASGVAVWAVRSFGNADPTVVFHPLNVEAWTMTVRRDKSLRWREVTRGNLRSLGRVVNPDGWPPPTQQVGKHDIARPYTTVEERIFRLAYRLPGPADRSKRMWIVCGSLGAGLRGVEIAATRTSDLESIADGRWAVRIRGRHPRLVPIRTAYTDLTRAAADASPTERFVPTDARNVVHTTVSRVDPRLSLRRARSTWLVAHITAGTPLPVLRRVAGPLSLNTLNGLLDHIVTFMDDDTAALGALSA